MMPNQAIPEPTEWILDRLVLGAVVMIHNHLFRVWIPEKFGMVIFIQECVHSTQDLLVKKEKGDQIQHNQI